MTRNRMSEESAEIRLSHTNPPENETQAQERANTLEGEISLIEAELDHRDPNSFPSEPAYLDWRRRATGALGHIKGEHNYIQRWLKERYKDRSVGKYDGNLKKLSGEIKERARVLAEEIGREYTPLYSEAKRPSSMEEAIARRAQLNAIKQQLVVAFAEITEAWTDHPLRGKALPGVKKPLKKILAHVEVELGIVKSYLRSAEDSVKDWRLVCAQALLRANASGFILTPEENRVLSQLRLMYNL